MGSREDVELGRRIARHRKRVGMSQQALAAAMRDAGQTHWRQTTASRVENGTQPLTFAEMAAIQQILGFDPGGIHSDLNVEVIDRGTIRRLHDVEDALRRAMLIVSELRNIHGGAESDPS